MNVVVALGNFDGVHLGHQVVLRRAAEEGRRRGERVIAATFHPHPRAVLAPGSEPRLLTTLELRREALHRYGADEVRVIRFDEALSRMSPTPRRRAPCRSTSVWSVPRRGICDDGRRECRS